MQLFIHFKVQQVEMFLSQLSRLNQLHQDKSFQFAQKFYQFVNELIQYFRQIGDSISLSEAEKIRNYYQMAEEGIDPEKLEKVKTGRRSLNRKSAFHCLSNLTELLQQELNKDHTKLEEAEHILGQLLISLIQAEAISPEDINQELNQDELENLWNKINKNAQVKLHEQNLRLKISKEDIYLLFGEVLKNFKN